jgi:hypothetical protein
MPRTTHGFTPTAPALGLVLLCVNILKVTQKIEPEKDASLRDHPSILRDPDETPEEPDAPDKNGDRNPAEGIVNELESRLFKGRKVMVFGQITDKLARDVVSRVLALVDESAKNPNMVTHGLRLGESRRIPRTLKLELYLIHAARNVSGQHVFL